jgi:hypothetical protein
MGETGFHENSLVNRTYTQPLFTGSLNTSMYIQSCVGTWVLKFFHHQASDTNGVEWNRMVLFFFSYSEHLAPICDFVDCVSRYLGA